MWNKSKLPWTPGALPLMLAPMQGLTNRALRSLFIEKYRPDVVFTEYVRVRPGAKKSISESDRLEVTSTGEAVPLVVQLIGADTEALIAAAHTVQELGTQHLNINLGCPYGRMTNNSAGGALLRDPVRLAKMLGLLRQCIHGSFSVKVRSGFDDPSQILSLVKFFEECGIDFLIVHPRTVLQKYGGKADHQITAAVVRQVSLPVIANGDIRTEADGRKVLAETGAAGLMMGRGAIADPHLFDRLRCRYPNASGRESRLSELREYLQELLQRYQATFCGDHQVLCKMKEVVGQVIDPDFAKVMHQLIRSKKLAHFAERLVTLADN